jgi:hypothetical protein
LDAEMAGRLQMSVRPRMLIAGFLALAAPAEAQAQICRHSSTTSLYVCFLHAPSPGTGKQGVAATQKNMKAAPSSGPADTANLRLRRGK